MLLVFWVTKYVNNTYQKTTRKIALSSELIFLNLFHDKSITIKERETGKEHSYALIEMKQKFSVTGNTLEEIKAELIQKSVDKYKREGRWE